LKITHFLPVASSVTGIERHFHEMSLLVCCP
jgi:hypothetical protein